MPQHCLAPGFQLPGNSLSTELAMFGVFVEEGCQSQILLPLRSLSIHPGFALRRQVSWMATEALCLPLILQGTLRG